MSLAQESKKYVIQLFNKSDLSKIEVEYNLKHSEYIIKAVQELSKEYSKLVDIAAWFHDVGKINGEDNHAEKSLVIVKDFLKDKNLDKKDLELICDCVLNHGTDKIPATEVGKAFQAADKISFLYAKMAKTYVDLSIREGKTKDEAKVGALRMLDGVYSKVKPDFKQFAKEKYESAKKAIESLA